MTIEELRIKIRELTLAGNYEDAIKFLNEEIELLKNEIEKDNSEYYKKELKAAIINKLGCEIKLETDRNKQFYLRGHLIKELKEFLKDTSGIEQNYIRFLLETELAKHKEMSKNIRVSKENKIPLKEKVGNLINEIKCAIEVFLSKHDVIKKIKNTTIQTLQGSALSIGISTILSLITGNPLTLETIASELPVCAYIGLSSLIKNIIVKTPYQKYSYKQSDEYKELISNTQEEFKEEFDAIRNLLESRKSARTPLEYVEINNKLAEYFDKIRDKTKVEELKEAYKLEKHNLLLENKEVLEEEIEKCANGKKIIPEEEYRKLNKYKLANELKIFESENAIKEGTKNALKQIGINVPALLAARVIASAIIPGYQITDVQSILEPLSILVANDLLGIVKYNGKIKNTKYKGKKIKFNDNKDLEVEQELNSSRLVQSLSM